jgi:glycosyltransferase involved in cell wall biosynthesis
MGRADDLYLIHENDARDEAYKKANNVINPFPSPRQLQCLGIPWVLKQLEIDVFHSVQPFYQDVLPFYTNKRLKKVLTLHDLSTLLYPETHTSAWLVNLIIKHIKKRSDTIITVSEHSRRDLMRYLKIPGDRISVIYNAVDPQFRPIAVSESERQRLKQQYRIPDSFVLYVGTLEPRKNIPALLKAYRTIRSNGTDHRLVIAGNKGWKYREIFELVDRLKLHHDVIFTGYVPDQDLPLLYNLAEIFVYPSLYEGFGLPPLEAMACGTPVVSSSVSSIPEVVGDAGILVYPSSADQISESMRLLIEDENYRNDLRRRGLRRSELFSGEETARRTWAVYETLMKS